MHVLASKIELRFPSSASLKEKRALLRPVIDGARHRFSVSVAEVDYHEKWQRAVVGVAVVAESPRHAEEVTDSVDRFVWSFPELEVVRTERYWLERL